MFSFFNILQTLHSFTVVVFKKTCAFFLVIVLVKTCYVLHCTKGLELPGFARLLPQCVLVWKETLSTGVDQNAF